MLQLARPLPFILRLLLIVFVHATYAQGMPWELVVRDDRARITQLHGEFGSWAANFHHVGVDVSTAGQCGSPIYPLATGQVISSSKSNGQNQYFGHYIVIKHAASNYTFYAHLEEQPALGDEEYVTNINSPIGKLGNTVGNTGSSSSGCHLHFEMRTSPDIYLGRSATGNGNVYLHKDYYESRFFDFWYDPVVPRYGEFGDSRPSGFSAHPKLDGWDASNPSLSQAFIEGVKNARTSAPYLGVPWDNGGGNKVHCWSTPGDNDCSGGVWLQDLKRNQGQHQLWPNGHSVLILNLEETKVYHVKEGFWAYYVNHDGFQNLGAPLGNEVEGSLKIDGVTRTGGKYQKFEKGTLFYHPNPSYDATSPNSDGITVVDLANSSVTASANSYPLNLLNPDFTSVDIYQNGSLLCSTPCLNVYRVEGWSYTQEIRGARITSVHANSTPSVNGVNGFTSNSDAYLTSAEINEGVILHDDHNFTFVAKEGGVTINVQLASNTVSGGSNIAALSFGANLGGASPGGEVTVSYRVTNSGDETSARANAYIIWSSRADLAGGQVAETFVIPSLSPGEVRSYEREVDLPVTAKGQGYLGVKLASVSLGHDIDQTDNIAKIPFVVGAGLSGDPDLRPSSLSTTATMLFPGQTVKIDYEIKTNANGSPPYKYVILHSSDKLISDDDVSLYEETTNRGLGYHGIHYYSKNIQIPLGVSHGATNILVQVDPDNSINEESEDNNLRSLEIVTANPQSDGDTLPNIAVGALTVSDPIMKVGKDYRYIFKIPAYLDSPDDPLFDEATQNYELVDSHLFISSDDKFDEGDVAFFSGLDYFGESIGEISGISLETYVPSWVTSGDYYLFAVYDLYNKIAEDSEIDNVSSPTRVTIVNDQSRTISVKDDLVTITEGRQGIVNLLENDLSSPDQEIILLRFGNEYVSSNSGHTWQSDSGLVLTMTQSGDVNVDATGVNIGLNSGDVVVERFTYVVRGLSDRDSDLGSLTVVIRGRGPDLGKLSATQIGKNTVTLNTEIFTNDVDSIAWFDIGTGMGLGNSTDRLDFPADNDWNAFSTVVAELECDTKYYYRAVASNIHSKLEGPNGEFTTLPCTVCTACIVPILNILLDIE